MSTGGDEAGKQNGCREDNYKNEWPKIHERRAVAFGKTRYEQPVSEGKTSGVAGEQSEPAEREQKPEELVGLALSGGGLRSALFNDGFLQALSHKGLLRYVDYLCSVSGGGYIAGHLMTFSGGKPAEVKTEGTGFHNPAKVEPSPANSKPPEDWHLGRDPDSGQEDQTRLPNAGAYLNRTTSAAVGYLRHQVPIFCFYVGLFGCIATLVAIFYRSFDSPLYRSIVDSGLGGLMGGEMTFAFLPTLLIGCILLLMVVLEWVARFLFRGAEPNYDRRKYWCRSVTVFIFLFGGALMASVAVFLGNSITSVDANGDRAELKLNYFANYIALIAGAIQILVFMGRDRLFKSERSEASNWKKRAQTLITHSVVYLAIFAMIHMMASENISHFTYHRGPYLVRGEVQDWTRLAGIFDRYGKGPDASNEVDQSDRVANLDLRRFAKRELNGNNEFSRFSANNLAGGFETVLGYPTQNREAFTPEDAKLHESKLKFTGWKRIGVLGRMVFPVYPTENATSKPATKSLAEGIYNEVTVEELVDLVTGFHFRQNEYLAERRETLECSDFTNFLLGELHYQDEHEGHDGEAQHELLGFKALGTALHISTAGEEETSELHINHEWIANHTKGWSKTRIGSFERLLQQHSLTKVAGIQMEPPGRVKLNHDLLELTGEGLLRATHIPSTPVVQPHDQQARWRWLTIWAGMLVFGLFATSDLNAVGFAFRFYRKQISRTFLRRRPSGNVDGDTKLPDLTPTADGLPYPIYLASWLRPDSQDGTTSIVPHSVTFTPDTAKVWEHNGKPNPLAELDHSGITLSQAVAASGAAITPLMTNNFALSAILDFFGSRLGIWLPLGDRRSLCTISALLITVLLSVFALVSLLRQAIANGAEFPWLYIELSLVVLATAMCLVNQSGYPTMLVSFFGQLAFSQDKNASGKNLSDETLQAESANAGASDSASETHAQRALKHWPNLFVSDGGFHDFLGVTELLHRRCELIVVSDAGVNSGETTLESLAKMCEQATSDMGVRFLDLDHDDSIDFGRLNRSEDQLVPQPYLAMRIQYPPQGDTPDDKPGKQGYLFYAQMAITENDPIEIQQIRHRFPSFPDEPTTNQFYTDDQVAAYQHLGYHIGNRVCSHLERWEFLTDSNSATDNVTDLFSSGRSRELAIVNQKIESLQESNEASASVLDPLKERANGLDPAILVQREKLPTLGRQPYFQELTSRLIRSYVQACYEEYYYREDDVYVESIWRANRAGQYPTVLKEIADLHKIDGSEHELSEYWLSRFSTNADLASAYLQAVNYDVNRLSNENPSLLTCKQLGLVVTDGNSNTIASSGMPQLTKECSKFYTAHLVVIAAACQQLHRGSSNDIFQVGGRRKLVDIVAHLVQDLSQACGPTPAGVQSNTSSNVATMIIQELFELNASVFQTADNMATLSFTQCLCEDLVYDTRDSNLPDGYGRVYDIRLDFRQLMLDALRAGYLSHTSEIVARYIDALKKHETESKCRLAPVAVTRDISSAPSLATQQNRPK